MVVFLAVVAFFVVEDLAAVVFLAGAAFFTGAAFALGVLLTTTAVDFFFLGLVLPYDPAVILPLFVF